VKVAKHAKAQALRSQDALYAHAATARALIKAQRQAQTTALLARFERRPLYYLLQADHTIQPIVGKDAVLKWAREFEHADRQIAHDDIDGWHVSTIFMGLDQAFNGPPLVFETMAFTSQTKVYEWNGRKREYHEPVVQRRYSTYAQALAGHQEVLEETRAIVTRLSALTRIGIPKNAD
jgi:hypothetical protein